MKEQEYNNEFDFENAQFYFINGVIHESPYLDKQKMKDIEHNFDSEARIYPYIGTFSRDVTSYAKDLAELSGFENVIVKKADGLNVEIYTDGIKAASFGVYPIIYEEYDNDLLPDGNPASMLTKYGWDDYEKLEKIVMEQDSQFEKNVESITGPETGMKQ